MRNNTTPAEHGGALDLRAYVRGAAALLRARGVPVSRRAVGVRIPAIVNTEIGSS
jgi:hypothetical protein